LLIVWWFLAASSSPEYYAVANGFLTSWFGDIIMTLSVLGLWYHTLAGVRHLIWDMGIGLDIPTAEKMGWAALIGSVVLTIITIIVV
jgi:succinate dehydrogenase / fumarate reductase cytochrome b subunit